MGLSTTAVTPATAAPAAGTKATYAGEVTNAATGRIDSDATISRVKAMNANTYAYLVWRANEWEDFKTDFMPKAQAAGLKVWVYITPPSEGSPPPYGSDYIRWAQEIATVRATYPNLTAWAIDDFNANVGKFTPAYLQRLRDAANAISPGLDLYATVYWSALKNTSFADTYGPKLDGFIFPFRDEPYTNTMGTATVTGQLNTVVANAARTGDKVFLMPYASKLSSAVVPPDVNYVKAVTQVGLTFMSQGKIPGIVQYNLPLTAGQGNGDTNRARTGTGALRFEVEPNTATTAGSYAAASTTVTLNAGSTTCSMVAFNTDTAPNGGTAGYHFKQALAGGTLVWERDVATDGTGWYTNSPANLTPYLVNGSTTLTLRLYDKKGVSNYALDVSFDDLALTGCHLSNSTFETPAGWTFSRAGGWVFGAVNQFNADYSGAVHAAVAAQFS
ncbi:hypothetical protein [Microlunatus speluncae]|uniref:hypothetical protein n=1 Tax=Microlunatus speluncae TaxID=2594267 RepID=UPI00126680BF|nr:hypothetical protein [Microlunatus speluncae]